MRRDIVVLPICICSRDKKEVEVIRTFFVMIAPRDPHEVLYN